MYWRTREIFRLSPYQFPGRINHLRFWQPLASGRQLTVHRFWKMSPASGMKQEKSPGISGTLHSFSGKSLPRKMYWKKIPEITPQCAGSAGPGFSMQPVQMVPGSGKVLSETFVSCTGKIPEIIPCAGFTGIEKFPGSWTKMYLSSGKVPEEEWHRKRFRESRRSCPTARILPPSGSHDHAYPVPGCPVRSPTSPVPELGPGPVLSGSMTGNFVGTRKS